LGREIILSKEEELAEELTEDWNSPETSSPQLKESLKIRIWKMASFPTATIPYIEANMSQPTGSLKYDELDSHEGHFQLSQRYYNSISEEGDEETIEDRQAPPLDFNCREYFTVKWKVSYLLDIRANVSQAKRVIFFLLFAIGLMFILAVDTWRGRHLLSSLFPSSDWIAIESISRFQPLLLVWKWAT
jgi:hypothetical protein